MFRVKCRGNTGNYRLMSFLFREELKSKCKNQLDFGVTAST